MTPAEAGPKVPAMLKEHRQWISGAALTAMLVGVIAAAIADVDSLFFPVMVGAVAIAVAVIHGLFPGSRLFSIALANLLGVYACVFVFFLVANFGPVDAPVLPVGFLLPVAGFLVGCWRRRETVRAVVRSGPVSIDRLLPAAFGWLAPVFAIGAITFLLPGLGLTALQYDIAFLAAMAGIALVVFLVAHEVAAFLVETGLLFEEFFERARHLVRPAFAFITFYSLLVILFASLYRIIDRYSAESHFLVQGQLSDITFPEALYFSIVNISTVGFGDIVPHSDLVRILSAIEIVLGVLLLLFGVSEILAYSRERRERGER